MLSSFKVEELIYVYSSLIDINIWIEYNNKFSDYFLICAFL